MDNQNNTNNENNSNKNIVTSANNNSNHEASQDVAHTVGRGASRYFGGEAGGKIYDAASKTKLGQGIEKAAGKSLEKNHLIGNSLDALHNSRATDAANKAMDVTSKPNNSQFMKNNNRANQNMFKGSKSKTATPSNNNPKNPNNINRGHNLVAPVMNNEVDDELTEENIEQQNEEIMEEQLEQEEALQQQEMQEKKEKKKKRKAIIKAFLKNPIAPFAILSVLFLLLVIFIFIWAMVTDFDIVGTGMKNYSQAEAMSGNYCNQINLIKEHENYPGNDIVNDIDDVNLEETFKIGTTTYKRWSVQTYDIESYVKGVVQAEAINVHDEKTFEVASMAARTYALQITSKLCRTWDNENIKPAYHNPQNFTTLPADANVVTAVSNTTGLVISLEDKLLKMSDGNYYDYFCHIGKDVNKENRVFYKMLQENEEERLLLPISWVKKNVDSGDFNRSGKYGGECQKEGMSLYGAKYLLNKEADAYDTIRIIKYYYSYDVVIKRLPMSFSLGGSCGDFNMLTTTLSKDEFVALLNQYSGGGGFQILKNYAGQIYDMAIANNFNPELVFTRAQVEGYSPGGASNNFWGIGCTNSGGRRACQNYGSIMEGALAYMNVMKGYNVSTLFDVYNVRHYAFIGSSWYPGSASSGGCYYLPHIAKYYTNSSRYSQVKAACDSGTGGSLPTNSEDQEAYSHFQIEKMLQARKSMFNIDSENCDPAAADINVILNSDASIGIKAAQLAVAKFDSFGYSQPNRWGDNQVDCSSLVYRTYAMLGINFGGSSTSSTELNWCKTNNRMIAESQLQPGDLLFKPGHVEIYIGNGQRFGAHTDKNRRWEDQVSVEPYRSGYFTEFCRPY